MMVRSHWYQPFWSQGSLSKVFQELNFNQINHCAYWVCLACLPCLTGTHIVHTQWVKINNVLFKWLLGAFNMQVRINALCVCVFLYRVYSRIAVIPFNRVSPKQDLGKSMAFQTELKPLLERAIESIGVILELSKTFKTMQSDSIFDEILAMSNELSDLDMRAQFNYSLLLFSTGKVYHNYVTILTSCI